MKKFIFYLIIFIIALSVRIYYNKWGIVHYKTDKLPKNVFGTVYTYMPDEKEFLGCYRALGWSAAKVFGGMLFKINIQTLKYTLKNIINGNLTFAPVYPTTFTPLMSYFVFFISLPIIFIKFILRLYPEFSSNYIFADALIIGKYLTTFFNILILIPFYKILKLFNVEKKLRLIALFLFALLPANIIISHYLSYNPLVSLLEILTFYLLLNYFISNQIKYIKLSALTFGLAISTKLTAITILPLFLFIYYLKNTSIKKFFANKKIIFIFLFYSFLIYLVISLYGILTNFNEFSKSIICYYYNLLSSPKVTFIIPKILTIKSLYFFTLPTGLSIFFYIICFISFFYFLFNAKFYKNKLLLILYFYILIWLAGASFSALNMLMRLITLITLVSILAIIFLNSIKNVIIKSLIIFLIFLNLILDNFILLNFYKSEDIRITSSKWIIQNIQPSKKIGIITSFPYWYFPEIIFTDFFWNENKIYSYDTEIITNKNFNIDYIITAKNEFQKFNILNNLTVAELFDLLKKNNFILIKKFSPDLSIGNYKIRYESDYYPAPNIFVSDIFIFQKIFIDEKK